uniref:uncharacterized protein LOC122598008 n=1 Tax=Erigeron canadensis TaxID=72917 RepID=UPI001CB9BC99|nr:uncharacterized protein LOC122598008 [Erigeron canadensis]
MALDPRRLVGYDDDEVRLVGLYKIKDDYPESAEEESKVHLDYVNRVKMEKISKRDLNLFVLDTLYRHNLHDTANAFSKESNDTRLGEYTFIREFVEFKEEIEKGNFDTAINLLGEAYLAIWQDIHFDLQRCKFLHLLCSGESGPLLSFADEFSRWASHEHIGDQLVNECCKKTLLKLININVMMTSVGAQIVERSKLSCLTNNIITRLARIQKCEPDGMIERGLKMLEEDIAFMVSGTRLDPKDFYLAKSN